jgi:hypothetical protein
MTTLPASFWDQPISIRVVDDEHCPSCQREGSPKVCDEAGRWHWKCLSSYDDCKVAYWLPGTNYIEYKLTPEKAAEQALRIREEIRQSMIGRRWISRGNCSRMIADAEPLPEGWTEGTGDFFS